MSRLFHLAERSAWEARGDAGWRPRSLAAEGFVHLSFARQLAGTLAAHFADARELVLVEVDRTSTRDALHLERSRGGEPFPHLHRALEEDDVVATWVLRRGPAGFRVPNEVVRGGSGLPDSTQP